MSVMLYTRGGQSPRVFIAVPAYSGSIGARCVISLHEGVRALEKAGIGADLCIETGNCHVDDTRNSLVRQFLETDCTDLVFIDEDVGFQAKDLVKLVTVDCDVVAGVYPKKQHPIDFPVFSEPKRGEIVEVGGAPTGFMRIRRHVLEKLRDKAVSHVGTSGHLYHTIFERMIHGDKRWSGDYAFCRKWIAEGGKVHVIPEFYFTHSGMNTWAGSLAQHWFPGPSEKFHETLDRLIAGDSSPEIFTTLFQEWGNEYAAPPDLLYTAWVMAKRAGTVLESGSGLSTLVMATAADVHALEADPLYYHQTVDALERHGLKASVHYAQLSLDGFYEMPEVPEVKLGFCDGPQRRYGRERFFSLPQIQKADLLIDDYGGGNCGCEVHVMGRFAIALRKDHDGTRSNQSGAEADRRAGGGPISVSLGNGRQPDGPERDAPPVGSERPSNGLFANCNGG